MSENAVAARDALLRRYLAQHPVEAARALDSLDEPDLAPLLAAMPAATAARLVAQLTPDRAEVALRGLAAEPAAALLAALEPRLATTLLASLPAAERESRLQALPAREASELRELLDYPEDTAGRLMDARPLALHPSTTAGQALERLRGRRDEAIHAVYLVEPGDGRLLGTVPLQALATASPETALEALDTPPPAVIQGLANREEVVEILDQSGVSALPVIDVNGRLLGVIRYAALVRAAREEATADLQTMVGVSREERALSPVSFAVRKRLPWLQINLVTAFLAAAVVGLFEKTIAANTALAVLLPVVAGQSGNTGSQALAVVIRALALREIRVRDWFRVCDKETRVALLNSLAVALVTCVAVFFWSGSSGLALVIGLSMVISMTIAGLSGAAVPIVLTAVGQDPAQSSSIVLTTVTDVVGFFSFLGIATLLASLL
jgi:magnesium transporter